MWQANRFVSLLIHILEGFAWRTSTCGEVVAEFGSPAVQLVEHPAPGLHRKMFMPGPGLAHPKLWDERVHLGVELHHHVVGVVMVGGHVVARRMARGAPEQIDAGRAQGVGGDSVAGSLPELEGDMVDARFRRLNEVDDVVLPIAGEEVCNSCNVVGEPEAEKVLEESRQLVAFAGEDRYVPEAERRCAGLLEAGRGSFDRIVELDQKAARSLDLNQLGNAGLVVGLDRSSKAKFARVAGEIVDRDVGLQVKAHMEQSLLLGWTQDQVVVVVADREVDRSVVSPRDLGALPR